MREFTIETVTASSRTIVATTGAITLVLKLTSKCLRSFSIVSLGRQPGNSQNKVRLQFTLFGHNNLLCFAGQTLVPGFQFVSARRNVFDHKPSFLIGRGKEWILQHHDHATHPAVNRAKHIHAPGLLKGHLLWRRWISIQPKIEWVVFRQRKYVVQNFVIVWPFNGRPDHHRQHMRDEGGALLRDPLGLHLCRLFWRYDFPDRPIDENQKVAQFSVVDSLDELELAAVVLSAERVFLRLGFSLGANTADNRASLKRASRANSKQRKIKCFAVHN